MNSTEIYHLLQKIAGTPGKNDKLALVKAHIDDSEFIDVLVHAYNPFIVFGVGAKTLCEVASLTPGADSSDWDSAVWNLLRDIRKRTVTGTSMINALAATVSKLNAESAALLKMVLLKDLRAGFSESTINKAHKGLIPTFPYMRCSLPADSNLAMPAFWKNGAFSQTKADGMFVNTNFDQDVVWLTTRAGTPVPLDALVGLEQEIRATLKTGTQSHGELIVVQTTGDTSSGPLLEKVLSREIGNGMLNSVLSGGTLAHGYAVRLKLWDQIPIECVVPKGKHEVAYKTRLAELTEQLKNAAGMIQLIATVYCKTKEDALAHYREQLAAGEEGTAVKSADAFWRDGTSKDQVKFKLKVSVELRVKGYNAGTGKNVGSLGSIKLESECSQLKVDVNGRGDDMRADWWANREARLESIVTINANDIMHPSKAGGVYSLFLPVFEEHRLDKSVADSLDQIKAQFAAAMGA